MMRFIFTLTLVLGMSSWAAAQELPEVFASKNLKDTVVLRVDSRTDQASYTRSHKAIRSKSQARTFALRAQYSQVPNSKMRSELDRDGGTSSWYFYGSYPSYGNYYYPRCNWYGNYYNPYYYYNYGYYNYYYYGNNYGYGYDWGW